MPPLTITTAQRDLIAAVDAALETAFAEGVDDGSTTFIPEMTNYATKLPAGYKTPTRDFVNAGFAAAMAAGAFQGPTPTPIYLSEAQYGDNCGVNFTASLITNNTDGAVILVTGAPLTMTGIAFWWDGIGSSTVRLSLWNSLGTRVAYVDVAVTGAGIYTGTFAGPQVLTPYTPCRISKFDTAGNHNWKATTGDISTQTGAAMASTDFHGKVGGRGWWRGSGVYSAGGDVAPTTTDTTAIYFVDPVFE